MKKAVLLGVLLVFGCRHGLVAARRCVSGDFTLHVIKGNCDYVDLQEALTTFMSDRVNVADGCGPDDARQELVRLLVNDDDDEEASARIAVETLCRAAMEDFGEQRSSLPLEDAVPPGLEGQAFVEHYYQGASDWNEQVATLYPQDEDGESNLLARDAALVKRFYEGPGTYGRVEWPEYIDTMRSCVLNTVYCCWPQDRQARDGGNGNCREPYDTDCVDENPADNTDLCFVEHNNNGWFSFPGDDKKDNDESEGPIHCHGFAWADDHNSDSFVYRANNLFYVSMYDHLYKRGYVRNIPGAPMCACAEQMPTVSRSDCTEMDIKYDVEFRVVSGTLVAAMIVRNDVEYKACSGLDERLTPETNDLWSYVNRLYVEGRIGPNKVQGLTRKLVGDLNCRLAEKQHLAQAHGLVRGRREVDGWTRLASNYAMGDDLFYGRIPSNALMMATTTTNEPLVLLRLCATCQASHREVYYKRVTPFPPTFHLLDNLKYSTKQVRYQRYGHDFLIYSSYDDAMNNVNAWECLAYNYQKGFPGDCGPNGTTVKDQQAIFNRLDTKLDVAWYVKRADSAPTLTALDSVTVGRIKYFYEGATHADDEKIYMVASGRDIWSKQDSCRFHYYKQEGGDLTLSVHIEYFESVTKWSKAGLMIRQSLGAHSASVALLLTGQAGIQVVYRPHAGAGSFDRGWKQNGVVLESTWLKLHKRGNVFTAYKSSDGHNWEFIYEPFTVDMDGGWLYAGLAMTSNSESKFVEAVFADFRVDDYTWPSIAPSATPAPSMTVESVDVGTWLHFVPGTAQRQGDKWYLKSKSPQIGAVKDGFHFVNQQWSAERDFQVTARVTKPTLSRNWAKAGLMIRDSLNPQAKYAFVLITAGSGIAYQERREFQGGSSLKNRIRPSPPYVWLRLRKVGNEYTAFRSHNGNDWVKIYSSVIEMDHDVLEVGMALTSTTIRTATEAEFEGFSMEEMTAV